MDIREMQDEILRLKKENDICVLSHAFQSHDIWEIADYVGDTFDLSQLAAKAPQRTMVICGVRFMAETVKILSPIKESFWLSPAQGAPWSTKSIKT